MTKSKPTITTTTTTTTNTSQVEEHLYAAGDASVCPATPAALRSGGGRTGTKGGGGGGVGGTARTGAGRGAAESIGDGLPCGYSDAPGWRIEMEDAICRCVFWLLEWRETFFLFSVFFFIIIRCHAHWDRFSKLSYSDGAEHGGIRTVSSRAFRKSVMLFFGVLFFSMSWSNRAFRIDPWSVLSHVTLDYCAPMRPLQKDPLFSVLFVLGVVFSSAMGSAGPSVIVPSFLGDFSHSSSLFFLFFVGGGLCVCVCFTGEERLAVRDSGLMYYPVFKACVAAVFLYVQQ